MVPKLVGVLLLCLLSCVLSSTADPGGVLITPNSGMVMGRHIQSYNGRTVTAFEGIPYANPPVGPLRFQKPEIVNKWSGVLFANTTYTCMQFQPKNMTNAVVGTENCLYLYVYVPRESITGNENLNVVVSFHNGAFMHGNPAGMCGPDYIMDRDLVYVSVNYRLGVLGFLSTEDEIVPGNNGLKDQVLALQWVKDNIQYFGGNPNSITITGLSAGAASVHFHYLSPMTIDKDLFHRGLSISGTALNPWVLTENPAKKAKRIAVLLNCTRDSSTDMVDCLKQVDAEALCVAEGAFFSMLKRLPITIFGPVIEKGTDPFLHDHPYKILLSGKIKNVPWITSNTKDEGLLLTETVLKYNGLEGLSKYWDNDIPSIIDFKETVDQSNKQIIAEKLLEFYLKNETLSLNNIQRLTDLFSDRLFKLDAEKAVRLQAKISQSPVYYYLFSYQLEDKPPLPANISGVGHIDDASLLYKVSSYPKHISGSDEKLKNLFIDFIYNFASGMKPRFGAIEWEPVKVQSDTQIRYLHINGPDDVKMETAGELALTTFWDNLPIKENQHLFKVL